MWRKGKESSGSEMDIVLINQSNAVPEDLIRIIMLYETTEIDTMLN